MQTLLPLTFAKPRCLLKLEYYFWLCLSTFKSSILLTFSLHIIRSSEFFVDNFRKQMKRFVQPSLNWLWRVFNQSIESFVFLRRALWKLCSQSQIKHVVALKLLSLCYKRIGSCFKLCVYLVMDATAPRATLTLLSCPPNFPRASITRYTQAKHEPSLK